MAFNEGTQYKDQLKDPVTSWHDRILETAVSRSEKTLSYFEKTGKSFTDFIQDLSKEPFKIIISIDDPKSITEGVFQLQNAVLGFPLTNNEHGCDGILGPYTFREFKKLQLLKYKKTELNDLTNKISTTEIQPALKTNHGPIKSVEIINLDNSESIDASQDKKELLNFKEKFNLTEGEYRVILKYYRRCKELGSLDDLLKIENIEDEKRSEEGSKLLFRFNDQEWKIYAGLFKKNPRMLLDLTNSIPGLIKTPFGSLRKVLTDGGHDSRTIENFMENYEKINAFIGTEVFNLAGKAIDEGNILTIDDFVNYLNELIQGKFSYRTSLDA